MFSDLTNKRFILVGAVASFSLLTLYFVILSLANSFSHAISQFSQMWYWILILVIGFGVQVGLYFYIRESFRLKQMASPTTAVAASGGISTGSMIACCLHHLVDVLPIMGLAAAALFLIKYQIPFLVIGILSNLIGIIIMLEIIQKNNLTEGFLKKILVYDTARVKKLVIGLSLILVPITFFLANKQSNVTLPGNVTLPKVAGLPEETNSQGGISFEVKPLDFSFEKLVQFEIKIDTHSGSLDFDLTKISILEDDKGNKYQPLEWQGSPLGGHHLAGILIFPKLNSQTKKINLTIQDNLPRVFEWDLK